MERSGYLSASAFLVNESRARNVGLSGDPYARLWVTDETRRLWEDFTAEVYPHDAVQIPLRNRFFLEQLLARVRAGSVRIFVNLASGFTSYPFLVDDSLPCIEVDMDHVIRYKRERIERWQAEGVLPERNITFVSADLRNRDDLERLDCALRPHLSRVPSFILIEGLSYYLDDDVWRRILGQAAAMQRGDSILAFDYWRPSVARHPVILRFKRFCEKRFGFHKEHYNFIEDADLRDISGYAVELSADVQELEKTFAATSVLENEIEIIPESYAVMRKLG